ncbi:UDP-N-acetylglucosamine 2-epimerase [candidate division WWE3 bacterium RBG_19FT_COMBO_34_6]|uniref:UDP-N-acetylglucosamine 2-epimerase n=1 Tax=candidate division WWE3 bacterium RBG_19FT_COMBO_34_6 TaxID=1802612 RepID=A0A1F4UKE7_UNCKA|nr:MAG: UDP-N-acetylglucosamine 2-epimerase [candidate division WWE3 bacterium RBG_19FT_COMBO_34_6]
MSDIFFKSLKIKKPDYNLKIGSGKHGEMTGKIMTEFEKVVEKEKPDLILVYGDTNTTLAGALVAAKSKIKLAHVEAGLRMFPKTMPEEINRVLTDRISDYLFCPTKECVNNLKKEGITKNVFFTGDVMYDLFLHTKKNFTFDTYKKLKLTENDFVILTLHRDYNVDDKKRLMVIVKELYKISKKIKIIFPIHPRTQKRVNEFKLNQYFENIICIEPLDYPELMGLVLKSWKIITDSGGLQKESYFAGKHSVVIMYDAGWRELTDSKYNILSTPEDLYQNVYKKNPPCVNSGIFGYGDAGKKIVRIIKEVK